jgi:hypothetical protein
MRRLVDARKPYPSWSQNPSDPQRVAKALRESGPPFMESYSRLKDCQPAAMEELLAAHKRMLDNGVSVRQEPVIALGTLGQFVLNVACEKADEAAWRIQRAIAAADDPGPSFDYIGRLEDTTTPEWVALLNHLDMEVRDALA